MFTHDEIDALLSPAIQAVLQAKAEADPRAFVLAHSKRHDWPLRAMAELLDARQRAQRKLPGWPVTDLLIDRLGSEQCSALDCAQERADRYPATTIHDVCGGIGVDAAVWAQRGAQVHHYEIDAVRSRCAAYNHAVLGLSAAITHHCADGLATDTSCELVYCDPARRDADGRRAVDLAHLHPSPPAIHAALMHRAERVLYKLAPATEATEIRRRLPGPLAISYISIADELKECLVATAADDQLTAIALDPDHRRAFTDQEPPAQPAAVTADNWLWLARPVLRHSGLHGQLATHQSCLAASAGLFLAAQAAPASWPIRSYRCLVRLPWQRTQVRGLLDERGIKALRILSLDPRLDARQVAAQLGIAGTAQKPLLIIWTGPEKRREAALCDEG